MTDEIESNNERIEIFSLKLINGDFVLAEIVTGEEEDKFLEMVNPVIVQFVQTAEGQVTVGREYDPLTEEASVMIPWGNLMNEPLPSTEFYREFYARTLQYSLVKRIRAEITRMKDKLALEEFHQVVAQSTQKIAIFTQQLSERYQLQLQTPDAELDTIVPSGTTLH